eukprot:scaffold938_cov334-Pavlova_lutheri.AAC.5
MDPFDFLSLPFKLFFSNRREGRFMCCHGKRKAPPPVYVELLLSTSPSSPPPRARPILPCFLVPILMPYHPCAIHSFPGCSWLGCKAQAKVEGGRRQGIQSRPRGSRWRRSATRPRCFEAAPMDPSGSWLRRRCVPRVRGGARASDRDSDGG